MQTSEHDFKAAREEFECDMIFVLIARGLTDRKHLDAIERALLIAEKLMSEPSEGMIDAVADFPKMPDGSYAEEFAEIREAVAKDFKAMCAKLIEEIDHAGK